MAETYRVQLAPDAERRRRSLSGIHILELERIFTFLSVQPYPRAGRRLISTRIIDGRTFFRFAQRGLPFFVEYRVYEPETGTTGLVVVTQLADADA